MLLEHFVVVYQYVIYVLEMILLDSISLYLCSGGKCSLCNQPGNIDQLIREESINKSIDEFKKEEIKKFTELEKQNANKKFETEDEV